MSLAQAGSPAAAIVLAGGAGTRLRQILPGIPKVLAPVAGKPFIHHLLDQLAANGITSVVLATGYAATDVEAAAAAYQGGLEIRFSREDQPLGTGGAIARAFERIRAGRAWVFNGDSLCGASLGEVAATAAARPDCPWLVAVAVDDASRFGTLALEGTLVTGYLEKTGVREPGWINAGIYLLPRDFAAAAGTGLPCSIERDLFPAWAADGLLHAAAVRAPFIDIGTPESLGAAGEFVAASGVGRRPFVFLDRDGTIIVQKPYLDDPAGVELIDGAAAALRRLREAGFGLAVVTNQSGIARGYFDKDRVEAIHERMRELLALEGLTLDAIYICPHAPGEGCLCRKPAPGMIDQAAREHRIDLGRSFIVGDKECDVDCGRNAGIRSVLVKTGYGREQECEIGARAAFVVDGLGEAAETILAEHETLNTEHGTRNTED